MAGVPRRRASTCSSSAPPRRWPSTCAPARRTTSPTTRAGRTCCSSTPGELEPDDDYVFDLDGAYELALSDPDPYTVSELSDLVDLVQRVAEVCDDGTLLKLVEQTPGVRGAAVRRRLVLRHRRRGALDRVGAVVERSWEPLLERFCRLVEWRGTEVLAEDVETTRTTTRTPTTSTSSTSTRTPRTTATGPDAGRHPGRDRGRGPRSRRLLDGPTHEDDEADPTEGGRTRSGRSPASCRCR